MDLITRKMIEERCAAMQEDIAHLCCELVKIKSVNPPGDELPIAQYVADYLRNIGLQVELISHQENRASVLALRSGSGTKSKILLSAHLDTVPVSTEAWTYPPFRGVTTDGKIWGRGTADMKAGLAAMMTATAIVSSLNIPLQGDLILAFTAGEEVDSLGAQVLVNRPELQGVQAVLVSEPSNNDIYIAEKGALWLELTTHGKTAHGSMPDVGRNAIVMMITLLREIEAAVFPHQTHQLLGSFSKSINTISGGVKTNIVPDICVSTIDMRTIPGQQHEAIVSHVETIISNLSTKVADFSAEVRIINNRPAVTTPVDDPMVKKFVDIVGLVRGKRPVPTGVRYYTDAATYVPVLKSPMIICGPGEPKLAHQPNEHVSIDQLNESMKIYALAIGEFLT